MAGFGFHYLPVMTLDQPTSMAHARHPNAEVSLAHVAHTVWPGHVRSAHAHSLTDTPLPRVTLTGGVI